jgi:hypothetical protein
MPVSPRQRHLTTEAPPAAPLPPQIPACTRCGCDAPRYRWQHMCDGRRHLRAECSACGRFIKFVPQIEPYLALANSAADQGGA